MLQSLRAKLLLSYSAIGGMLLLFTVAVLYTENARQELEELRRALNTIKYGEQSASSLEKDFLSYETINPEFYETRQSEYLIARKVVLGDVSEAMAFLKQNHDKVKVEGFEASLLDLASRLIKYEEDFDSLRASILRRGFKDHGLEGEMREHIHRLEEAARQESQIELATLLSIRRHEKDYIIRKQEQYITKLQKAVDELKTQITALPSSRTRDRLLLRTEIYENIFMELVAEEKRIGFSNAGGLRSSLAIQTQEINEALENLTKEARTYIDAQLYQLQVFVVILAAALLLLVFFLSLYLTQKLGKPVKELSEHIHKAVKSKFEQRTALPEVKTHDEIGKLAKDFGLMLETVHTSLSQIKAQKAQIEKVQEHTLASIRYAQTIQEAILPDAETLNTYFEEWFVLFRPQHYVSGDFYWLYRKRQKTFLAVADCTGHGVPGAFMSMIGNTTLNNIIEQSKVYEPALMLEILHLEISRALHQDEGKNTDGMDISICAIQASEQQSETHSQVVFAGAKNHAIYYDSGKEEIVRFKGTKRSIGGKQKKNKAVIPFENQRFELRHGDALYLYSDGFPDQHDMQRQKLGSKAFMAMLEHLQELPMTEQGKALEEKLSAHQGEQSQRDDITVLGLRMKKKREIPGTEPEDVLPVGE